MKRLQNATARLQRELAANGYDITDAGGLIEVGPAVDRSPSDPPPNLSDQALALLPELPEEVARLARIATALNCFDQEQVGLSRKAWVDICDEMERKGCPCHMRGKLMRAIVGKGKYKSILNARCVYRVIGDRWQPGVPYFVLEEAARLIVKNVRTAGKTLTQEHLDKRQKDLISAFKSGRRGLTADRCERIVDLMLQGHGWDEITSILDAEAAANKMSDQDGQTDDEAEGVCQLSVPASYYRKLARLAEFYESVSVDGFLRRLIDVQERIIDTYGNDVRASAAEAKAESEAAFRPIAEAA